MIADVCIAPHLGFHHRRLAIKASNEPCERHRLWTPCMSTAPQNRRRHLDVLVPRLRLPPCTVLYLRRWGTCPMYQRHVWPRTCKAQLCRGWGQLGEALRRGVLHRQSALYCFGFSCARSVQDGNRIRLDCDVWSVALEFGCWVFEGFGPCLVEVGTEGVKKLYF